MLTTNVFLFLLDKYYNIDNPFNLFLSKYLIIKKVLTKNTIIKLGTIISLYYN